MGRRVWILLLLCFWVVLAGMAFSNGQTSRALTYLAIGGVLTAWRLSRS